MASRRRYHSVVPGSMSSSRAASTWPLKQAVVQLCLFAWCLRAIVQQQPRSWPFSQAMYSGSPKYPPDRPPRLCPAAWSTASPFRQIGARSRRNCIRRGSGCDKRRRSSNQQLLGLATRRRRGAQGRANPKRRPITLTPLIDRGTRIEQQVKASTRPFKLATNSGV